MFNRFAAAAAAIAALCLPHADALAQDLPPELAALDERLDEIAEDHDVVGASWALADANGVIFADGIGYADREAGIEATGDTPFRAGSVSKLLTAMAAMRLVEAGRLDLDTPLADIAPEIAFTNRWEDEAPVRLVHLVEHTAGWDDIQLQEYRSFPEGTTIAEGLADNPRSRTARWAPGLYHSYANSGPAVIGRVIEIETGRPFEQAMEALIFDPLGLETASFDQDGEIRPASYASDGERSDFTRIWAGPSGALAISARDLVTVGAVLMTDGAGFMTSPTVARMERGETSVSAQNGGNPYGLGLFESRDETGLWIGHNGAIDAAQAEVFYNRQTGMAYALMVNTSGPAIRNMRRALRDALGGAQPAPEPAPGWTLADSAAGTYRIVNPRQEMTRALIDLFEPISVTACGAELCVARGLGSEPLRYTPMGGGRFYKTDEPFKRLALIEGPRGWELVYGGGETFSQTSALRLGAPVALWIATLVALIAGLITLLVWAAARPFGVFAGQNRWRVWTWPSLAALSFGLGMGALMMLSMGDVLANFAGPSLGGRVLQLGTLAFGPIALVGVWAAVRAQDVRLFARAQAGLTSALLVLAWGWMFTYGWAGLTPWSYTPGVMG
ncbi:MAG: serine hydrolase domain-containing protein [Oceanicaulis sp.]